MAAAVVPSLRSRSLDGQREGVLHDGFSGSGDPGLHGYVVRAGGQGEAGVNAGAVDRTVGQLIVDIDGHGVDATAGVGSGQELNRRGSGSAGSGRADSHRLRRRGTALRRLHGNGGRSSGAAAGTGGSGGVGGSRRRRDGGGAGSTEGTDAGDGDGGCVSGGPGQGAALTSGDGSGTRTQLHRQLIVGDESVDAYLRTSDHIDLAICNGRDHEALSLSEAVVGILCTVVQFG